MPVCVATRVQDGRIYFYNAATQVTQWEMPADFAPSSAAPTAADQWLQTTWSLSLSLSLSRARSLSRALSLSLSLSVSLSLSLSLLLSLSLSLSSLALAVSLSHTHSRARACNPPAHPLSLALSLALFLPLFLYPRSRDGKIPSCVLTMVNDLAQVFNLLPGKDGETTTYTFSEVPFYSDVLWQMYQGTDV